MRARRGCWKYQSEGANLDPALCMGSSKAGFEKMRVKRVVRCKYKDGEVVYIWAAWRIWSAKTMALMVTDFLTSKASLTVW